MEDDASVARFLEQAVSEAGYTTKVEGDGLRGLKAAQSEAFDLILLDVMLPSFSGLEVCRNLRAAGVNSLVLMITARDATEDKVAGLDAGADDYLCKPFKVAELLARMRALLRRGSSGTAPLRVADLTLNPATRQAQRGGKTIALSATEYSLLEFLMRHADRVMPRTAILDQVWDYDFGGSDNVLDVYIMYLRNKIDKGHEKRLIHTARGIGFWVGEDH